jgi:hypothetical protein
MSPVFRTLIFTILGAEYEEYCRRAPRWLPRLKAKESSCGTHRNRVRGVIERRSW